MSGERYTGLLAHNKATDTSAKIQTTRRASAPQVSTTADDPAITPRSVIRYRPQQPQPIRRGNQEAVFHYQKPPLRFHPIFYCGVTAIGVIACIWIGSAIWNWGSHVQEDIQYGLPRTYQTDAVVGHNDSKANPTHFVFLNLHGVVHIIEFPGGKGPGKDYVGPTLGGDDPGQWPVTGQFDDETGQHTIDMVVIVDGQRIVFLNDGTQFKQQQ